MRLGQTMVLAILAVTLPAASLPAQDQNLRKGFFLGVGFGAGSERLSCSVCQGDRDVDITGYLKLGWAVNPHVLLGVESDGWKQGTNGITELLATLHAAVYWYPSRTESFYFKGGMGVLAYRVSGDQSLATGRAFSAAIGAGYDFRFARDFSFTPFVNVIGSIASTLTLNDTPAATDVNYSLLQVGLGVTWH